MKAIRNIKNITMQEMLVRILCILLVIATVPVHAQHDGHDHGAHDHGSENAEESEMHSGTKVENHSGRYEALLKFTPVEEGEPLEMKLYISHYETNAPLDSAEIQVTNVDLVSQKFVVAKQEAGIFKLTTTMIPEGFYNLDVMIRSPFGDDFISLADVDFRHPHALHEEESHSHASLYWIGALVLVLGLIAGYLAGRKASRRSLPVLVLLCLVPSVQWTTAHAQHDGHDHGPVQKNVTALSSFFTVPKETQFLLNVRTQVSGKPGFERARRLYATVIPASEGQAAVISPQAGKMLNVLVKPGEKVIRGQTLALLERTMDAASDISFMAEKNRIDAEFEAARKEYERLKSIQDIASKKSFEEAEARYISARENRELFNSGVRTLTLKAPIDGIVAPFVWSKGTSVHPDETLFTINNLNRVYVEAQAFERDLHAVVQAKKFLVQCVDGHHESAEVKMLSLGQEYNAGNQSQRVLFELNNEKGDFKLGEFVNLWVYSSSSESVISAPNSAITEVEGRPVVFVKKSAEQFELRYVALGENNGKTTEIRNGLKPGEIFVSEGAYQVKLIYLNQ